MDTNRCAPGERVPPSMPQGVSVARQAFSNGMLVSQYVWGNASVKHISTANLVRLQSEQSALFKLIQGGILLRRTDPDGTRRFSVVPARHALTKCSDGHFALNMNEQPMDARATLAQSSHTIAQMASLYAQTPDGHLVISSIDAWISKTNIAKASNTVSAFVSH